MYLCVIYVSRDHSFCRYGFRDSAGCLELGTYSSKPYNFRLLHLDSKHGAFYTFKTFSFPYEAERLLALPDYLAPEGSEGVGARFLVGPKSQPSKRCRVLYAILAFLRVSSDL